MTTTITPEYIAQLADEVQDEIRRSTKAVEQAAAQVTEYSKFSVSNQWSVLDTYLTAVAWRDVWATVDRAAALDGTLWDGVLAIADEYTDDMVHDRFRGSSTSALSNAADGYMRAAIAAFLGHRVVFSARQIRAWADTPESQPQPETVEPVEDRRPVVMITVLDPNLTEHWIEAHKAGCQHLRQSYRGVPRERGAWTLEATNLTHAAADIASDFIAEHVAEGQPYDEAVDEFFNHIHWAPCLKGVPTK
jgi:hypothetical protein